VQATRGTATSAKLQVVEKLHDPHVVRFIQPDIYSSNNIASAYAYVNDQPTRDVDPSGKFWCIIIPQFPWIECHPGRHPVPPVLPPSDPPLPTPCPPGGPPAPGPHTPGIGGPLVPGMPGLPGLPSDVIKYGNCLNACAVSGFPAAHCRLLCRILSGVVCSMAPEICGVLPYPDNESCLAVASEMCP
jgi:hypothetical protein